MYKNAVVWMETEENVILNGSQRESGVGFWTRYKYHYHVIGCLSQ